MHLRITAVFVCALASASQVWGQGNEDPIMRGFDKPAHTIQWLNNEIARNPKVAQLYKERGDCNANMLETEAALADYNYAIKLDPKMWRAYLCRARANTDIEKVPEAEADYKVAENSPDKKTSTEALKEASRMHLVFKQFALAVTEYTRLLNGDPRNTRYLAERSQCYTALGKYDLALKDADLGVKVGPQSWPPRLARARVYAKMKQWEKALADFDSCIPQHESPREYEERAKVEEALGKPSLAARDYKMAKNNQKQSLNDMPFRMRF